MIPDNPRPGSIADERRQERIAHERGFAKVWLAEIRAQLDKIAATKPKKR